MQAYFAKEYPSVNTLRSDGVLIVYFAGCNFRCPSCNVPTLVEFKEEFLEELKDLKSQIQNSTSIKSVLLTGGEPTLQRQALLDIGGTCRKLRLKIGIHTNGSKPLVLKSLLKRKLIDYLIMDVKAPLEEELFQRATRSRTFFLITKEILEDIKASLDIIKKHNNELEIEFRTLIVPGMVYKKEQIESIGDLFEGIECRWNLVQFTSSKEKVLSKSFRGIKAPTKEFITLLRDNVQKKFPHIRMGVLLASDLQAERSEETNA